MLQQHKSQSNLYDSQRSFSSLMKPSNNIDMKADAKSTISSNAAYSKCTLSSSALKQGRFAFYTDSMQLPKQINDPVQQEILLKKRLTRNESKDSLVKNTERVVSVCFNQNSPYLNMISSASIKQTNLVNNPLELTKLLIQDQLRQQTQEKIVGVQKSFMTLNKNASEKSMKPSRIQSAHSAKFSTKSASYYNQGQSFMQSNQTFISQSTKHDQNQSKFKRSFSQLRVEQPLHNRSGNQKSTCLVWNKDTQNLVLQTQASQDKLSSLFLKQRKMVQLQEMVDRKAILQKPKLSPELEKVIPADIRKAADDVERELERMLNTQADDSRLRAKNVEIDQKIKGRMKNGIGLGFLDNGDLYSGAWKDGIREGYGTCKFFKGGYYKGEWANDQIVGNGIQVKINGLTISGTFVNDGRLIPYAKYQIFYPSGEFYEGQLTFEWERNGKGVCWYNNGDYYEGDWKKDKRTGKGKLIQYDGTEFEGNFLNDQAEGEGKLIDKDRNKFEASINKGYFQNGRLQGKGKAHFMNGDIYKGLFKEGKFHGKGKMQYKNIKVPDYYYQEATYSGEWKHGRKHGEGKIKWADGSSFKGLWENDQRVEGKLKMKKQNKIYEGQFKNDIFHGKGKLTFLQQKFSFEGQFMNGECLRKGTLKYFESGQQYEGDINKDFEQEGTGKLLFRNGDIYEGQFLDSMMNGHGLYKYKNGDYYKGEFLRHKKHGFGQFYCNLTRDLFEGQFRDDERNGEGTLYLKDGTVKKGSFKGDQIVSKTAEEKRSSAAPNVEKLYNWGRGSLMDKAANRLLTNRI